MLNVKLSYNPTIYWIIFIRYGGHPSNFSHMKIFRSLADPGGVYRKGIIFQSCSSSAGFPVARNSQLRRKGDVIGAYSHTFRPMNNPYGKTVRWYIYNTRWPEHPHLPIRCHIQRQKVPSIRSRCTCRNVSHILFESIERFLKETKNWWVF